MKTIAGVAAFAMESKNDRAELDTVASSRIPNIVWKLAAKWRKIIRFRSHSQEGQ